MVESAAERFGAPNRIADLDAAWLGRFAADLRAWNCTEKTIDGYLSHLRAALQWAVDQGMLGKVPKIKHMVRARGVRGKGRAITAEEFERMLMMVPAVTTGKLKPSRTSLICKVARTEIQGDESEARGRLREWDEAAEKIHESWRFYLRGLWWSGLRLGESLELWWDRDDQLCVDLSGKRPMLRIPAELEKGNRDRTLPISPEFAALLESVPPENRTGRIFNPQRRLHGGERLSNDRVTRLVGKIGEKANVKVWTHPKTGKVKFEVRQRARPEAFLRFPLVVAGYAGGPTTVNAARIHRYDDAALRRPQRGSDRGCDLGSLRKDR